METGDKTVEHLEMAAVKEGNHIHTVDDIDWRISEIDYLCQWQLMNYDPRILNCDHCVVARHIGHYVDQYLLSSVEIHLSSFAVNKDGGKQLSMRDVM